ncbi:hypothetical protein Emed_000913 [Eimeria media]
MQQQPLTSTPYMSAAAVTTHPGSGFYPSAALQYLQQQQQQVAGYCMQPQVFPESPEESSIQTCMRDSIRLLGEAVAVVEGVRLLGSQLLQWAAELTNVAQSLIPVALLMQIGRWIYTRTWGASRRRALYRMSKVWQEANGKLLLPPSAFNTISSSSSSSSSRGVYGVLSSSSRPRNSWGLWVSRLGHLFALLTLLAVAAELYVHFHIYRRLVARLRLLRGKGSTNNKPKRSSRSRSSNSSSSSSSSSSGSRSSSRDISSEDTSSSLSSSG